MDAELSFYKGLFLWQHNNARSLFGEAIVAKMPISNLRAFRSSRGDPS